jgi:ketosteroid isomerase-like protein/carbon monoxide dehydrogenase subunit G
MIEAEHALPVMAGIDDVWDYVKDIRRWANLFPGCRECEVLDTNDSRWTLKVGAGGLVKTVKVRVHVERWDGPNGVDFEFALEGEPVKGGGSYRAERKGSRETGISLRVRVEGSGPMAPMWEAVSKPLLPQLAKAFAGQLKVEIEKTCGVVATAPAPSFLSRWIAAILRLLSRKPRMESTLEANKKVVLTFIEAMGSSNSAMAVPCLSPEAFTEARGYGKFAGIRRYETMVGTIDAFNQLLPTGLRPSIKSVTAEGDRVAVEWEGNAQTSEGKAYCNHYCMVFTLKDGKITQVMEYFCNVLADEVLWPLVASMQSQAQAS